MKALMVLVLMWPVLSLASTFECTENAAQFIAPVTKVEKVENGCFVKVNLTSENGYFNSSTLCPIIWEDVHYGQGIWVDKDDKIKCDDFLEGLFISGIIIQKVDEDFFRFDYVVLHK